MAKDYIEKRENGYFVVGSRVSLDSIIYNFLNGLSPESIVESFPTLTLEEVYGGITFYLANRASLDLYLAEGEQQFEKLREESRARNTELHHKLEAARRAAILQRQK